jgi:hypothetical protein
MCSFLIKPSSNDSPDFFEMFSQVEKEKLFIYCIEELRLLIERPYEHDSLIERLTAISTNLENLYECIFIRER